MPSCPHCMYNRLIINDLYDNSKNICFHLYSHALLCFEVDFYIICLLSAIYSLFIDRSSLV